MKSFWKGALYSFQTIDGNVDNISPMTYFFKAHFQGRYIRVIPAAKHNQYTAMAFDILVCPHSKYTEPL